MMDNKNSAFIDDLELYNKKIVSEPTPEREIGIDTKDTFAKNTIDAATDNKLNISELDSFSQASQNRETVYRVIDTMLEDSTVSAIMETYAEDATETADTGHIVWAESSDADTSKYVNFLLDSLNVDKNVYKWVSCLCKYGDVYLRLFRKSDVEDELFDDENNNKKALNEDINKNKKEDLKEDINIKLYHKNDKYEHYVEMVPNPAEMFELTKFGKTYAYIQANVTLSTAKFDNNMMSPNLRYIFRKKDVDIYPATSFVHGCLEDNFSRSPETVDIFLGDTNDSKKLTYSVKSGQSLLQSTFKIWREMMLLENAMLLNRITKSSIARIVGVEVGDMEKEAVTAVLANVKNVLEQKAALNTNVSMAEYTNPGPVENNVYIPIRNGNGTITISEVGGDVDVRGIADIDYFKNKFFSSMKVPRQFFNETDDSTGFNGGTSLTIISSRYAKTIKKIQNVICQMITDCVNLMLLDKGLDTYVNKFTIKMLPPTTQEEIDRRDNTASKVQIARDIMDLFGDIEDKAARLSVLKSVLSAVVTDPEIISVISDQIQIAEEENLEAESTNDSNDIDINTNIDVGPRSPQPSIASINTNKENATREMPDMDLPSPEDLGVDLVNNAEENV